MHPAKYQLMLSEKLRPSVLVVRHDEGNSRLYNFLKQTNDGSVRYFQCSTCRQLNRDFPVPGQNLTTVIKIRQDDLELESPTHHPLCLPTCNFKIRAIQIHRSCKMLAKEGVLTARDAFERAVLLAAQEGPSVLAQVGTWSQAGRHYYDVVAQGNASRKRQTVDSRIPGPSAKRAFGSVDNSA